MPPQHTHTPKAGYIGAERSNTTPSTTTMLPGTPDDAFKKKRDEGTTSSPARGTRAFAQRKITVKDSRGPRQGLQEGMRRRRRCCADESSGFPGHAEGGGGWIPPTPSREEWWHPQVSPRRGLSASGGVAALSAFVSCPGCVRVLRWRGVCLY